MRQWVLPALLAALLPAPVLADSVSAPLPEPNVKVMPDVPSYVWYHGCGPTALGMIVGYYDAHGFDNLIPGSNAWNTNQQAIKDMIASPGYVRDYAPTPDRVATPDDPYHTDDSLADFGLTGRDPLDDGWGDVRNQAAAITKYFAYRGYTDSTARLRAYPTLWSDLTTEIDAGRPVELAVDSNFDGTMDHLVTAIGYDSTPGDLKYASYNTWDQDVHWYTFQLAKAGREFGVSYGVIVDVPEPTMLMPLALLLVTLRRRRQVTN